MKSYVHALLPSPWTTKKRTMQKRSELKLRSSPQRAFHNVCRHRGFPVVDPTAEDASEPAESKGKRSILACMYHGWKYNTDGTLFRAPHFQEVPGFDPKAHSLFPLRVHVDKNGFVYANADM